MFSQSARCRSSCFCLLLILGLASHFAYLGTGEAAGKEPARHGNVLVEGVDVVVRFPASLPQAAVTWRALDHTGRVVARGDLQKEPREDMGVIRVGSLGIGWYRVEALSDEEALVAWTTAAVLARLRVPPPADSPIALDSATAWFERNDKAGQQTLAQLAALAGVRWVRDRVLWRELQPTPGDLIDSRTTYDLAADVQSEAGLDVLQVFHDSPGWAANHELDGEHSRGRFARDLRHVYILAREAARRYRGRVRAWEPWNEANIHDFGGHSVDEMCAWQKASWLGFKTGDPELIVGWNAYAAVPTRRHTEGVIQNETWPYFDTYNIHSYDWPESYAELWGPAREAACGRPIWVTEADRGMKYTGKKPWCELSTEGELRKAEHMAHEYCNSLFAGAAIHYHFILGHYTEDRNGVQFGLLRLDHTPRPAYVAVAALGRLLAGARCLGRWTLPAQPAARIFAFRARPDGHERDVLVAWCEKPGEWSTRGDCTTGWSPPPALEPESVFDFLGRPLATSFPQRLGPGAVFLILPTGSSKTIPLDRPPALSPRREGKASPIVLQLQLPRAGQRKIVGRQWAHGHEHTVDRGRSMTLPLFAYNFSDRPAEGTIRVEGLPPGAILKPTSWVVSIPPMERAKIVGNFRPAETIKEATHQPWIRLRGDFGELGRPVVAFQIAAR